MSRWMSVAAFLAMFAVPLSALAQEGEGEKPYQPRHKVEPSLAIVEKEGTWLFVARAKTDFPDGVRLKVRVYVVQEVELAKGEKRIDEEPLHAPLARGFTMVTVKDGSCEETVFTSFRRPYSLTYRVRFEFENKHQSSAQMVRTLGEQSFAVHGDLRRGTPADFERELREARKEFGLEIDRAYGLFREFRRGYDEHRRKFDEKAWREWGQGWLAKVAEMADRNELLWQIWAVWLERTARMWIGGFVDRFRIMYGECTEALKGSAESLERLQHAFEYFMVHFEQTRESLGIDTPLDPEAVVQKFAGYAEAVHRLRAIFEKADRAAWAQESEGLRRRGREALLGLGHQNLMPRRGYERLAGLGESFVRMADLCDRILTGQGVPEDSERMRELFKRNDDEMRVFKAYTEAK